MNLANRKRFNGDKDEHRLQSRDVLDVMLDDGRDALNELSVEQCHARKSSKVGGTHHLIEIF